MYAVGARKISRNDFYVVSSHESVLECFNAMKIILYQLLFLDLNFNVQIVQFSFFSHLKKISIKKIYKTHYKGISA